MIKKTIRLPAGEKIRPAGMLVTTARKYESNLSVSYGGTVIDLKSMADVLGADIGAGSNITVTASGMDESRAGAEMAEFLSSVNPLSGV